MASPDALAMPTRFSSRRLASIQSLRGMAALMVVFHHVIHQFPEFLRLLPTEAGQAGVDLFFVISGFVMVYVTHERERSARQFLTMRAIRIIPVYWFYTLAATFLMFIMPKLFRANELTIRHVVLSLFFIPHRIGEEISSPVIKQGWTLDYEVFFYVLFAIAMAVWASQRVALSTVVLVLFAGVGYWAVLGHHELGTVGFYFDNIVLEFAFGMLIGRIYLDGRFPRMSSLFSAVLVVAGFIAMFALDPWYLYSTRVLVYGIPAAVIVFGALAFEMNSRPLRMPRMEFVGNASYSIYLVHIFPIAVIRSLWPREYSPTHSVVSFVLFLLVCLASAITLGAVSYYAVERTSLRYLRSRTMGPRSST